MVNNLSDGPHKNFESIKKVDENGIEYWEARELMLVLDYTRWENFQKVISKAQEACINSGQDVVNHFLEVTKMVALGSGAKRDTKEYHLSRYACYLIAQNRDPRKIEVALAQTYFAIQTRKQEVTQQLEENDKRLFIRGEVKVHNKRLFATARAAGVNNFGRFNNAGYEGLYGMNKVQIQNKKKIGKDDILDRAGAT